MLDIEINGQTLQMPPGSTVMDAATKIGVYVPHFCYHKKLSIAANCRMCLVEVEKAPKPLPACATPVTQGMKVFTHSKLATTAQRGVMEFLLINHPLDCPICDQGGECQLQDLAVGYGKSASQYEEPKHVVMVKNVGSLISMQEMSRCIHCTRCVRFGQEIAGVMELGMANRNVHSEIQTFVGRTVDSELSGNMIDICPVGALTSKPFRYSARSWELSRRRSISPHDSLGSNLVVQVKNQRVMRVLPHENEDINECWISDKDRFSYEALNSESRLTRPMIRVDGALREVDWNVALDYVSHALKDIKKKHGAENMAALASPHNTLEELALFAKLMRGLGSDNIDSRPRRRNFSTDSTRQGAPWLGMRLADIANLDSALVIGSFLRKDHPLFAQRLRQLAKKAGKKVSLISVVSDDALISLHKQMTVAPKHLAMVLGSILKAALTQKGEAIPAALVKNEACEESKSIAQSLIAGEKPAIFLGNIAEQVEEAGEIHALASELARVTSASFGFIGEAANSVGAYIAGAHPQSSNSANAYQMFQEPKKAYLLMGVEPELDCHNPALANKAIKEADFTVMLATHKTDKMLESVDALLPVAAFTETSGTFINTEGRVQSFQGVAPPKGEARPAWKVLRVLGNLLDLEGFEYESSEAVRDELIPAGTEFVVGLNNQLRESTLTASLATDIKIQRIADVPIYFADSLVRQSIALQKTKDAKPPQARLAKETLRSLNLEGEKLLKVSQEEGASCVLEIAVDETIPEGCIRICAAHQNTSSLGDMFGNLHVERAS